MKVLMAHNYYRQPGGEDQVFAAESALLEAHGHRVIRYTVHNDEIEGMSPAALARKTVWNGSVYRELRALIRRERPQVVHFHNTFPLISPAAYHAARAEGVPVVQTLHNYRLVCPGGMLFRDGRVCEECFGRLGSWAGAITACYRRNRAASGVVAAMLTTHHILRTWRHKVDVYVALTEFSREKFIQGGLPAEKIIVKPNFVHPDPGVGDGRGEYFLFVGRLSPEKGIDILLSAWELLGGRARLKIVGDGVLAGQVTAACKRTHGIEWLGRQREEQVMSLMKGAQALVFPSLWYEGFPRVIAEAYACGLPVIASDLGSMSLLVDHDRTGLRFSPGDPESLSAQIERMMERSKKSSDMRRAARIKFTSEYTAEQNYQTLMKIYNAAIGTMFEL